jgi:hypothetical protein
MISIVFNQISPKEMLYNFKQSIITSSLEERKGLFGDSSTAEDMLNHESEAIATENDKLLNGSLSGSLILLWEGNVGLDSWINSALASFEALLSPHGHVDVLPLSIGNRVGLHKGLGLISEGGPVSIGERL